MSKADEGRFVELVELVDRGGVGKSLGALLLRTERPGPLSWGCFLKGGEG